MKTKVVQNVPRINLSIWPLTLETWHLTLDFSHMPHLSTDMKTKGVQHVPRINVSIWHFTLDIWHLTFLISNYPILYKCLSIVVIYVPAANNISEIVRVQRGGRPPGKESKLLDVYNEKPVRITAKVLVPVKEHPRVRNHYQKPPNCQNMKVSLLPVVWHTLC